MEHSFSIITHCVDEGGGTDGIGGGGEVYRSVYEILMRNCYSLGWQHCCRCRTYSQQFSTLPSFKLLDV